MPVLFLLLLSILPRDDVLRETVDLVELNHFYDEHGKLVFDQVIFYDWCPIHQRFQLREWRLVKTEGHIPHKDFRTNTYRCLFCDNTRDRDIVRDIHARSYRETWLQYDPELVEREVLPKEKRKPFITPQR